MQGKSWSLWTGLVAHSVEALNIMFVLSHIMLQNKRMNWNQNQRIAIKMKLYKQFDFNDVWSRMYIKFCWSWLPCISRRPDICRSLLCTLCWTFARVKMFTKCSYLQPGILPELECRTLIFINTLSCGMIKRQRRRKYKTNIMPQSRYHKRYTT